MMQEEIFASPVRDDTGAMTHVVEEIRDIGELVRTKKVTEQLKKDLQIMHGIVPICAGCKKVREEDGTWHSVESYCTRRSEAQFSHGMCPDCIEEHYPDLKGG